MHLGANVYPRAREAMTRKRVTLKDLAIATGKSPRWVRSVLIGENAGFEIRSTIENMLGRKLWKG